MATPFDPAPAPNFSTAGGYTPGQLESTGGGYSPPKVPTVPLPANTNIGPNYNSGGYVAGQPYSNVNANVNRLDAPNFSAAGGYTPGQLESTGGGYDPTSTISTNTQAVPGAAANNTYTGATSPNFAPPPASQNRAAETQKPSAIEEDQNKFGYKVRLIAVRKFPAEYVVFEVTPAFAENRTVEYKSVAPIHMPGSIQVYARTNSRTFTLTAHFVSRTVKQATDNIEYLQRLRGWTMPYFGARSAQDGDTAPLDQTLTAITQQVDSSSMLGAPPDVLYLYAYSSSRGSGTDRSDGRVNIKKLPVVITSLGITYPEDVDYLPVLVSGEPFPTKMDVTIELIETHSPTQYENFSLSMFKQGKLVQF